MKNIFYSLLGILLFLTVSCGKPGEVKKMYSNDSITLYRFWYDEASYVYIAKLKGTTTLNYQNGEAMSSVVMDGKTISYTKRDVIYENDTIIIIKKK